MSLENVPSTGRIVAVLSTEGRQYVWIDRVIHIINQIAPCTKHHTVYIYVLLLQYVVAATKLEILVQIVPRIVN